MILRFPTTIARLLIAGLVAASYANSIEAPFTFDDWHVIQENPAIHSLSSIPGYFSDPTLFSILEGNRDYRPLFLTSMAIAWSAGDGSPLPFHLISIALHLANALLLYELIRRIAASPNAMAPSLSPALANFAALLGASWFAVHPLATESVVYASSQSVPLAAAFYLSSALFFVWGWSANGAPRRGTLRVLSPIAYIAALLSKPIAITLPLNLLLWDLAFGRRITRGEFTSAEGRARLLRRCAKHVPHALITLAYLGLRSRLFESGAGVINAAPRPYFDHFLTETRALVFYYLEGVILPLDLSVDREFAVSTSLAEPAVIAAFALLAMLAAGLFWLRRQRAIVFWSLWFPVCLLLTTYLLVMGQIVNEHRVYLSLAGACAALGTGVAAALARLPIRASDLAVGARSGGAAVLVLWLATLAALATGTHLRNREWSSELTLWETAAARNGTYRAHMNYARALESAGRSEQALEEFRLAVELGPYAYPHMNLGLAYVRRNENDRGLDHLRTAVRLWPSSPETHYFYGYALEKVGDLAGAAAELELAIEHRPAYPRAQQALDRVQQQLGGEATGENLIERFERRMREEPEHRERLLFELAFELQKRDRMDEAVEFYEKLLRGDRAHRQAHFNLGYGLLHSGDLERVQRSIRHFERVIEIDSSYTEALFHLASAHRELGDAEAGKQWDLRYLAAGAEPGLLARSRARIQAGSPRSLLIER